MICAATVAEIVDADGIAARIVADDDANCDVVASVLTVLATLDNAEDVASDEIFAVAYDPLPWSVVICAATASEMFAAVGIAARIVADDELSWLVVATEFNEVCAVASAVAVATFAPLASVAFTTPDDSDNSPVPVPVLIVTFG